MNIPKDEMTSKERVDAYFSGKEVDRLPCFVFLNEMGCHFMNTDIDKYYKDAETMKDVEMYLFNKFNGDSLGVGLDGKLIAEIYGGEVVLTKDDVAYIKEAPLKDYKELDNYKMIDPYNDGRMPILLKAIDLLIKESNGVVDVGSGSVGPMTLAASLRGANKIMRDLRKDPENVHKLLEFSLQTSLKYVETVYKEFGIGVSISDPISSCSLIGAKYFKEFSKPYLERYVNGIYKITGKRPGLHICGETKKIWDDIKELNIGNFSLDNAEDIGELKEAMGDKICIVGNVRPVEAIKFGTVEDVLNESKVCIEKAIDSPNGFVLSPGCNIPIGTKEENIHALVNACRLYARGVKMNKEV